nr:transposase [Hydrocoleum sp. CS-953]
MRISKRAGDWYISFKYDECQPKPLTKQWAIIGVDVGINALATCSDGTTYPNVKAYKQAKKRLTRYQRRVQKKEPGSKNTSQSSKKTSQDSQKSGCDPAPSHGARERAPSSS